MFKRSCDQRAAKVCVCVCGAARGVAPDSDRLARDVGDVAVATTQKVQT